MGTVNWGFIRVSSSRRFTPLEKMNFISTSACLLAKLTHQKSSAGELPLGARRFPKDFAKNSILQSFWKLTSTIFLEVPKELKQASKSIDKEQRSYLIN